MRPIPEDRRKPGGDDMRQIMFLIWVAASVVACTKETVELDAGPSGVADTAPTPQLDATGDGDGQAPPTEDAAPPAPMDATGSGDLDAASAQDTGAGSTDGEAPGDGGSLPLLDSGLGSDAGDAGGQGDAEAPPEPLPPGECVGRAPDPEMPDPEPLPADTCMICDGSPMPTWRLEDFQPLSCGLGQVYGVDTFVGAPTLVALFNAGCGYCQAQCGKLEEMRIEFGVTDFAANLVALNSSSNLIYQDRLAARCSIPLFQDTEEVTAMEQMQGAVFDMYVYRPDGTLHVYLSGRGDIETTLSVEAGYENVKAAIRSAAAGEPYEPPFPPMAEPDAGVPFFPFPDPDAGADD